MKVEVWIEIGWIETKATGTRVGVDRLGGNIVETLDLPMTLVIIHHLVPLVLGNQTIRTIMTICLSGKLFVCAIV